MRSERWRAWAMSSSSSTTRTRGAREKSFICLYVVIARGKAMVRPRGRFVAADVEVAPMASTGRRRPARRTSARRRGAARRRRRGARRLLTLALPLRLWPPRLALPSLSPAVRDLLGLALLGAGVFMSLVLYGGLDGGPAGHGLDVALGWLLGEARVLAPLALCAWGASLLLRGVLPDMRPLSGGAICLLVGITLALTAGTLGLTHAPHGGHQSLSSASLQRHGGIVGALAYGAAHPLGGDLGVGILVVFLWLAGRWLA